MTTFENDELTPEELAAETGDITPALMTDPKQILAFMFAGRATLTYRSVQTTTRYTYKVEKPKDFDEKNPKFFVKYLTGQDNENDYTYLGMIAPDRYKNNVLGFRATAKTKNPNSQVLKGFAWAFDILVQGRLPKGLEIWHEGRCARCRRKLTDPASIASGFGPECVKYGMGLTASFLLPTPTAPKAEADGYKVSHPVTPAKPTPASIVAEVNEDPKIKTDGG
jgi:hypothetical protein